MARTNIPTRQIQAGASGAVETPRVAATTDRYFLTIEQVGWPLTGGVALWIGLEYSPDNGTTWRPLTFFDVEDVPQGGYTFRGYVLPANTFVTQVPLPDVGSSQRRLRATWKAVKTISVSGGIDSLAPGDDIPLARA